MTEFITKLFDILFCWCPRFTIVQPDEKGVRVTCGGWVENLDPGLHWYWPMLTTMDTVNVSPQFIDLPNQYVTTDDGDTVAISGVVGYHIIDPKEALYNVQDYDVSLPNLAMGIIASKVGSDSLTDDVLAELNNRAEPWGIEIDSVIITDYAECWCVRLIQ